MIDTPSDGLSAGRPHHCCQPSLAEPRWFVSRSLHVQEAKCISGADLLMDCEVLPHLDTSCIYQSCYLTQSRCADTGQTSSLFRGRCLKFTKISFVLFLFVVRMWLFLSKHKGSHIPPSRMNQSFRRLAGQQHDYQ